MSKLSCAKPKNEFESQVPLEKIVEVIERFIISQDADIVDRKSDSFRVIFFDQERELEVVIEIGTRIVFHNRSTLFFFSELLSRFRKCLEKENIIEEQAPEKIYDFSFFKFDMKQNEEEEKQSFEGLITNALCRCTDTSDEVSPVLLSSLRNSKRLFHHFLASDYHVQMLTILPKSWNTTKRCILSIIQLMINNDDTQEYKKKMSQIDAKKTITELLQNTDNQRIKRYCTETLLIL